MAARCTATDQAIEACGGDPRATAAAAAGVKFFTSPFFSIDRFARSGQFREVSFRPERSSVRRLLLLTPQPIDSIQSCC